MVIPRTVTITRFLLLAHALVWLVFAALAAFGWLPGLPSTAWLRGLMAGLAALTGLLLLGLVYFLEHRQRLAYYAALALLFLIALLTLTDQLGWIDLVYSVLAMAPVILLIIEKDWYVKKYDPIA